MALAGSTELSNRPSFRGERRRRRALSCVDPGRLPLSISPGDLREVALLFDHTIGVVLFPDWAGLAAGDLLSGSEFPPSLLKNSQSQDKSARIIPYKDVFNRGRQIALIPHPERLTAKTSSG